MIREGQVAPEFDLEEMGGGRRTLGEILATGPAVIAFFKISCPVCQFAFPFLERVHRASREGDPQFVGVSQDGATATEMFLKEQGVSFPTLLDAFSAGYPASNAYGISNVPAAVVVEQDGTVSAVIEGFDKKEYEKLGLRAGISTFREGEYVPVFRPG